jgi:hypothetical protein
MKLSDRLPLNIGPKREVPAIDASSETSVHKQKARNFGIEASDAFHAAATSIPVFAGLSLVAGAGVQRAVSDVTGNSVLSKVAGAATVGVLAPAVATLGLVGTVSEGVTGLVKSAQAADAYAKDYVNWP